MNARYRLTPVPPPCRAGRPWPKHPRAERVFPSGRPAPALGQQAGPTPASLSRSPGLTTKTPPRASGPNSGCLHLTSVRLASPPPARSPPTCQQPLLQEVEHAGRGGPLGLVHGEQAAQREELIGGLAQHDASRLPGSHAPGRPRRPGAAVPPRPPAFRPARGPLGNVVRRRAGRGGKAVRGGGRGEAAGYPGSQRHGRLGGTGGAVRCLGWDACRRGPFSPNGVAVGIATGHGGLPAGTAGEGR